MLDYLPEGNEINRIGIGSDGWSQVYYKGDASIMAGVNEHFVMHLKLPYAELIQRETKKYYDIARSTRELETITAPTGESLYVLFANN